jgi:hypothetical protein
MALNLKVDAAFDAAIAQFVKDGAGGLSLLGLSTGAVGIGTTNPRTQLEVAGDVHVGGDMHIERNGSPKLVLESHGFGTQKYSIRATNRRDPAGERKLIIRNEGAARDDVVIGNDGTVGISGDVHIERNGSPRVVLESHGFGNQKYSIRATNRRDPAGERRLIIRNEGAARDDVVLDNSGNITVAGDIKLTGADCAEEFAVKDERSLQPGAVLIIGDDEELEPCAEAYDTRVAGVVSGGAEHRPGIILGSESPDASRAVVALAGKVYCRVDATSAPVEAGDLLTTSSSSGHAMKADDPQKSCGAVIGKALRALPGGAGLIPILVALQ